MSDTTINRLTMAKAEGKRLRKKVAREDHATLELPKHRDVLDLIHQRNKGRIPELIPVRMQRMSASAFAFFRGSADLMAYDLTASPTIGLNMVLCGDAHLANFGLFASPERRVLFDLNDFDESGIGPWEWDIKRLAASAVLAAREGDVHANDDDARDIVINLVDNYRTAMANLAEETILDRYYADIDADWLCQHAGDRDQDLVDRTIDKARNRTSLQAVRKIATFTDSRGLHFLSDPPLLVPVTDQEEADNMIASFDTYVRTLPPAANLLLKQFHIVDVARRVVGVGSVGTHSLVLLLSGPNDEPLVLQVKEALPSVLTTHGKLPDAFSELSAGDSSGLLPDNLDKHIKAGNGYRVVACQQILQAHSDPLLGWTRGKDGRGYYWRQFRDMKGSIEIEKLDVQELKNYCALCARLLARAHSQSPNGALVAGYIGSNNDFAKAIAEWAIDYANQTYEDFELFRMAIDHGEFEVADEDADTTDGKSVDAHNGSTKSTFDRALGL